jgi:hypothetical protein
MEVSASSTASFTHWVEVLVGPRAGLDTVQKRQTSWWELSWSQWPGGLRHELSSSTRTLESRVRIPLEEWMSVYVYAAFTALCLSRGLATSWSSVQGVLPSLYRITKPKRAVRAQQMADEPLMNGLTVGIEPGPSSPQPLVILQVQHLTTEHRLNQHHANAPYLQSTYCGPIKAWRMVSCEVIIPEWLDLRRLEC